MKILSFLVLILVALVSTRKHFRRAAHCFRCMCDEKLEKKFTEVGIAKADCKKFEKLCVADTMVKVMATSIKDC